MSDKSQKVEKSEKVDMTDPQQAEPKLAEVEAKAAAEGLRPTAEQAGADANVVEAAKALYDAVEKRRAFGPATQAAKVCDTCDGRGLTEHPAVDPEAGLCSACGGSGFTTTDGKKVDANKPATSADIKAGAVEAVEALVITEVEVEVEVKKEDEHGSHAGSKAHG
ncbi:MAG: hypothetical protein ABIW84_00105 [Ilumatobacteraceae bacterium]